MDIISLIGDSRNYNFHSHTQFCDGKAEMEEFVKEAVAQGFAYYGFSPHSPIPIESPCNMSLDDVPLYLTEVNRLKDKYGCRISLYTSMEIDYLGDEWGPSNPYFDTLPLDYRIGSIHFIPSDSGYIDMDGRFENFKKKMEAYFHGDIRHVVETFYRQSTRMLEAGGFDIIGHFDKIGHNADHYHPGIEDLPWYQRLVNDLIDLIIEKKVIVELNTKAWNDHHRLFPGTRHLSRLIKAQVPIIVNSDAHYPHLIDAARPLAFSYLSQAAT